MVPSHSVFRGGRGSSSGVPERSGRAAAAWSRSRIAWRTLTLAATPDNRRGRTLTHTAPRAEFFPGSETHWTTASGPAFPTLQRRPSGQRRPGERRGSGRRVSTTEGQPECERPSRPRQTTGLRHPIQVRFRSGTRSREHGASPPYTGSCNIRQTVVRWTPRAPAISPCVRPSARSWSALSRRLSALAALTRPDARPLAAWSS